MRQALIFLGLGLAAGFAMALWLGAEPSTDRGFADGGDGFAGAGTDDLAARLRDVEAALAVEAERRVDLEATLDLLSATRAEFAGAAPGQARQNSATKEQPNAEPDSASEAERQTERIAARRASLRERDSPEYRQQQLIDAGFAPDQARLVTEREAQIRMDALYAQYEATREGEPFNPLQRELAGQAALRAELGDSVYEQYLEATGQQTSVGVRQVLENSPGQTAGLQAGDQIVGYAGQRIFNLPELNQLTMAGQPGETVAVDIVRDGQPMQVYVPRGPIGITGGGRGFGFVPGRRP
jgi:C-terminal processing protease CtpA/Prc